MLTIMIGMFTTTWGQFFIIDKDAETNKIIMNIERELSIIKN